MSSWGGTVRRGACLLAALGIAVGASASAASGAAIEQVAGPGVGSSEPTYYGTQHRLAETDSGRVLAVHGLHGQGVRLAWHDPGGEWRSESTGGSANGTLLSGTETGDWPASIAVADDASGDQHAWVVFARNAQKQPSSGSPDPVRALFVRRISDLNSAEGPSIGPLTVVDDPVFGAYKADIAFGDGPDGQPRAAVVWSRRDADVDGRPQHETVIGWLTDLGSDSPAIGSREVLVGPGSGGQRWATLAPTSSSMIAITRPGNPALTAFVHQNSQAPGAWEARSADLDAEGFPSAATLANGEVLSTVDTQGAVFSADPVTGEPVSDPGSGQVVVQRYSQAAEPQAPELTLNGYASPTIAAHGSQATLVMVRMSDGALVSRSFTPGVGWSDVDAVELARSAPGEPFSELAFPNTLRSSLGRLEFVFEAAGDSSVTSSVYSLERVVSSPPIAADVAVGASLRPSPATRGRPVSLSSKVRNLGPAEASRVTAEIRTRARVTSAPSSCADRAGGLVCRLGVLEPGEVVRLPIGLKAPRSGRSLAATVSARSPTEDPGVGNNEVTRRVRLR